ARWLTLGGVGAREGGRGSPISVGCWAWKGTHIGSVQAGFCPRHVASPPVGFLPPPLHPPPPRHIVLHSCGLQPSSCPDVAPPFRALTFSPNCPAPGSSPPRPTPDPTIRPHSPAPAVRDSRKPSHSPHPRQHPPHRPRPTCFQCLSVRRPLRFRFEWTAAVLC